VTTLHLRGPSLLLTIGPAACGKSTVLGDLRRRGVVDLVISTDAIRADLGLAPTETARAYDEAYRRATVGMLAGLVVAADATNLRVSDRVAWRAVAARCDGSVGAIRLGDDLTLDDLVARDAGRDRHVPVDALREHLERFRRDASLPVLAAEGLPVATHAADVNTLQRDLPGAPCRP